MISTTLQALSHRELNYHERNAYRHLKIGAFRFRTQVSKSGKPRAYSQEYFIRRIKYYDTIRDEQTRRLRGTQRLVLWENRYGDFR
jgi:hypothetical protein